MSSAVKTPARFRRRRWLLSSATVLALLFLAACGGEKGGCSASSEVQGGLEGALSIQAGALPMVGVGLVPALWLAAFSPPGGGWLLLLDRFAPRLESFARVADPSRITLWALRIVRLRVIGREFDVAGGLGWGYARYKRGAAVSRRGEMGFRAELMTPLNIGISSLVHLGGGYSGGSWPGSGYSDTGIFIAVRVSLFGK